MRKELIEEVDLGPFKHKVDKGLSMRKQAYQLLETLLDRCVEQIDPFRLVDEVVLVGLRDQEEEVIALNLLILAKLCAKANAVVLSRIDQIVGSFNDLFVQNMKKFATKATQERALNILVPTLRCVHIFLKCPEM